MRFARTDDDALAARAPVAWRAKASAMRFEREVRQELVAGGLLADMLRLPPEVLTVRELPGGKPVLVDFPDIHFSISHSEDLVMCVVADRPVGCDVEKIVPLDDETAAVVGSIGEWTLREARFKCGPHSGTPRPVPAPDGYRAAVAESSAD